MKKIKVIDILNGSLDRELDDSIFWYASKVLINDNTIEVHIDNQNLVCFDDVNLDIKKISDLISIEQSNPKILENVLISSGSFLFINDKLAVTQRENTVKYDPCFWTTPAGRCDRGIFETGIKETIEEIKIEQNSKILYPHIAKPFIKNQKNIEFYDSSLEDKSNQLKTHAIKLYLDNILIEECKAWFYFSHEVNTMEFRVPIFTKLNEKNLILSNPEFGTDTSLKTIDELKKMDVVPALKQLLKEI